MKRTLFLLIPILLSVSCMGQRIALSANATMLAPSNMKALSSTELSTLGANKFKNTMFLSKDMANYPNNIFQVGNVLVLIKTNGATNSDAYLKNLKLALDNSAEHLPNYSSKIETIGDATLLILDEDFEGFKMYRFYGINSSGPGRVTGYIQYNAGDEANARAVLVNVIKGVKFKVQ